MKFISVFLLLITIIFCTFPAYCISEHPTGWPQVDQFLQEEKTESACKSLQIILDQAISDSNEEEWTRALIRLAILRTNQFMSAPETSVRLFQDTPWPSGVRYQTPLHLYYGLSLESYASRYGHEIRSRENITSIKDLDLKKWSIQKLSSEINKAYTQAWAQTEHSYLESWIEPGNYPRRIRGTIQDAVAYLWVDYLKNSSFWSPEHDAETPKLDLEYLMSLDPEKRESGTLESDSVHPLFKISILLRTLELAHAKADRPEAALEARTRLLTILHRSAETEPRKLLVRLEMEKFLEEIDTNLPWWAVGQYQLGELYSLEKDQEHLIRARSAYAAGSLKHPESIGGLWCQDALNKLEAPDLRLKTMNQDIPEKRSIQLLHRNINTVYFRAWRYDLANLVEDQDPRSPFPKRDETQSWIHGREPDLVWSQEVPDTKDFKHHSSYTALPQCAPSAYVVAASIQENFQHEMNQVITIGIINSDLIILGEESPEGLTLEVCSGTSGQPLSDVNLKVFTAERTFQKTKTTILKTDHKGTAFLPMDKQESYFVLAQRGDEISMSHHGDFRPPRDLTGQTQCFIYTDRPIYRPGQQVKWKIVAFETVEHQKKFHTLPNETVTIKFNNPYMQQVTELDVTTNEFGSASGSFTIPNGSVLGNWSITSEPNGVSYLKVEEYKRPTFEVFLDDPKEELRLGQPGKLTGRAAYYFGMPLTEGKVQWKIMRSFELPRRWRWTRPSSRLIAVASGETVINADGVFNVEFLPEGNPAMNEKGDLKYSYQWEVEVINEGGELIKESRSYKVGKSTVQGKIALGTSFVILGDKADFSILRTDLNRVPREGEGSFKIHALVLPKNCTLPSDRQRPASFEEPSPYETPGDRQYPRWPDFRVRGRLEYQEWVSGPVIRQGTLMHDEDGHSPLLVSDLEAGAYRLEYKTADSAGIESSSSFEFIVADESTNVLPVCLILQAEKNIVKVGEEARFFLHSDLPDQPLRLRIYHGKDLVEESLLEAGNHPEILNIPITEDMRGSLIVVLETVSDFQVLRRQASVSIPWDNQKLKIETLTFRDHLRCGDTETLRWKISSEDGQPIHSSTAELLAMMYDRSLDTFGRVHRYSPANLYSTFGNTRSHFHSLRNNNRIGQTGGGTFHRLELESLKADQLLWTNSGSRARSGELYVRGGRSGEVSYSLDLSAGVHSIPPPGQGVVASMPNSFEEQNSEDFIRDDFSETAFFLPHVEIDKNGEAIVEFRVPDSVTDWNIIAIAMTTDLKYGQLEKTASSSKDLLVRPYLPRFLREGDLAQVKVVLSNSTNKDLDCRVDVEILHEVTGTDISLSFGLDHDQHLQVPLLVPANGEASLILPLKVPTGVGIPTLRVIGRADGLADGEQRPLPVLPSRVHLQQSRFVALDGPTEKTMTFEEMNAGDDPTLENEKLVVTIDAQLFQSALNALPYLANYPYECTEQTLNRFLSANILSSLFHKHPEMREWAQKMAQRETKTPAWNQHDPNRRLLLEETPWLAMSQGKSNKQEDLLNLLDPAVALQQQQLTLAKLAKIQTRNGGFPWFPGGESSPYMTLYVLRGLARNQDIDNEASLAIIKKAWPYLRKYFTTNLRPEISEDQTGWTFSTLLAFMMTSYPQEIWAVRGFTPEDQNFLLDFSFSHWKDHSRLMKGYLSLALARSGRHEDAHLVFDSVLDTAHEDPDLGISWTPEDRSWLWINDTIESHAFTLRVMTELYPNDLRANGLAKWLLLNRQLNHWKSTRATAEAIHALALHMEATGTLISDQEVLVKMDNRKRHFEFSSDDFVDQDNHWVQEGEEIKPDVCDEIIVTAQNPGLVFASATWHFSTEQQPEVAQGNLLHITRRYFRRVHDGTQMQLQPLESGAILAVGDEVEVQLSISSRFPTEYVQLRDPRPAGFEPVNVHSGHRWQWGLGYYAEIRDNGINFFFENLPDGEFTLKHRLRANVAGTFLTGPATLQSMYAPEFTAYSSGTKIQVQP